MSHCISINSSAGGHVSDLLNVTTTIVWFEDKPVAELVPQFLMAYHHPLRQVHPADYKTSHGSPLRQLSNASTTSSAYSSNSNPFPPSRTSTVSSSASSGYQHTMAGHKRGIEVSELGRDIKGRIGYDSNDANTAGGYKSARQSLRPLPQPPNPSPSASSKSAYNAHSRETSVDEDLSFEYDGPSRSPPSTASVYSHPHSVALSRADSISPSLSTISRPHFHHTNTNPHGSVMSTPDLSTLKNSSTSHLRNLSKFAQSGSEEDFPINSAAPSVVGLHGRRQLKRTDSTRASKATGSFGNGWGERNWMDKQRQFLQAYEYLCHIGEAKEWIEDIIHKPIPPIVQLEEALRDGVTLAEIVQALTPHRVIRIFRHQKLQFRHSDNIVLFFRFLAEAELPELFRFELIDLYEKKNIPKVIYCIHALSWVLYKRGMVDFRIGNLVGQLEFEHHELEAMQKGLDKAGISMPSFSGMGVTFGAEPEPEPEPEPVESEEERIERELGEKEHTIVELQSQIRSALSRMRLSQEMEGLWDAEEALVDLQAKIRGDWSREIINYRLNMKRFATNLQSAARGYVLRAGRHNMEETWKGRAEDILQVQSLIRARKARQDVKAVKVNARREESSIRYLQAAIRGALERGRLDGQYEETRSAEADVKSLQAVARGNLQRLRTEIQTQSLQREQSSIVMLQAAARAATARSQKLRQDEALQKTLGVWHALQAASRGKVLRNALKSTRVQLKGQQEEVKAVQSCIRGRAIRQETQQLKSRLLGTQKAVTALQAASRARLLRDKHQADLLGLQKQSDQITRLQALARGCLVRESHHDLRKDLQSNAQEIAQLQALSRAMLVRIEVGTLLEQLDQEELAIEALQSAIRGMLVRSSFAEKKRFFKENMEKVVKVQSFVRGKLQGQAYKSLTNGENPPVGTVKGFVHLLNDSDFDFDEEVEFERLRKTVVQHVQQNEMADQYITQLDIKIALLVKNKITLDEVVKHQRHFGGHVGSLLSNTEMSSKDPFDLKALNKNSRRKLEQYQELFFVLQAQPQYLARLFRKLREQAIPEKECERIKHLTMGLFGYAQKRREEYYLLKLITRSVKEEVDSCHSLQDYLRGNFFWGKVFSAYGKSPRDRKFMRDALGPLVKENIIDNRDLDLESDPMQIYRSAIENEQLRTGQRSARRLDIPREEAIRDGETKKIFIAHLQDLRDIADQFFAALEDLLHRMPFGVRYIAQQMFHCLVSRFQQEEQGRILQIVGQWVWKSYLQPALLEPERFGVVDRGLSPEHKRNLGEVSKVLSQVAAGRLFGGENVFLQPLNSYVGESIERLGEIWGNRK